MKKLLSLGMISVLFLAFLAPFFTIHLWLSLSSEFPGGAVLTIIFLLIISEKLYAMVFHCPDRNMLAVESDWTAVAVGLSYTFTMYAVIIEFFWRSTGIFLPLATVFGFLIYFTALFLRYWSFYHLGGQWGVQLDQSGEGDRELIRTGPYRLVRHPLYLGACLECMAIPLIFNSFRALVLGMFIFIPLEIKRALFEEQFLYIVFGAKYKNYAREVNGFIPRRRSSTSIESDEG